MKITLEQIVSLLLKNKHFFYIEKSNEWTDKTIVKFSCYNRDEKDRQYIISSDEIYRGEDILGKISLDRNAKDGKDIIVHYDITNQIMLGSSGKIHSLLKKQKNGSKNK